MRHRPATRRLHLEQLETRAVPALVIDPGTIGLLPDTAGQVIELRVISTQPQQDPLVTGLNLLAQLGDGRGPLAEPVFTGVDFDGGIWDAFPVTETGGVVPGAAQFVQAGVAFSQGGQAVAADGLLVRLTVSTVGLLDGTFPLLLSSSEAGEDSHFVGSGGASLPIELHAGQITLDGVNRPPTAIRVSGSSIEEYLAGEVVGNVTVDDPDAGDTHELSVSDERFEIVAGRLKLKDDQFLRHAEEPQVTLRITARDSGTPAGTLAVDVLLEVVANPFPWQNSLDRLDVNRDGVIAPIDVLLVVNELNSRGSRSLLVPPQWPLVPPPFVDVSGDNIVAPGDALWIINFLNSRPA
ncbi:MAG: hypothetical protein J5I93_10215 [Pirellulaceae bacterium]|nr:hypothetical protein [Pirellulaceae bacterium]